MVQHRRPRPLRRRVSVHPRPHQGLIIRFGFNIYPPEIEAVLNAHPAVVQSAVIGRPAGGEEDVIAFVQPVAGAAVTEAELAACAAAQLAPYKRPARIFLVDALPVGPGGKILKAVLALLATAMAAASGRRPERG
jgi:acyl-CoA synthetase (AMP-forming)/AMP-acid ligase II